MKANNKHDFLHPQNSHNIERGGEPPHHLLEQSISEPPPNTPPSPSVYVTEVHWHTDLSRLRRRRHFTGTPLRRATGKNHPTLSSRQSQRTVLIWSHLLQSGLEDAQLTALLLLLPSPSASAQQSSLPVGWPNRSCFPAFTRPGPASAIN